MAPNVTLMIRSDIDLQTIAERLSRLYGVQPRGRSIIHSLALRAVTPELVEKLRCEPGVELVSYDVSVYPPEPAQ